MEKREWFWDCFKKGLFTNLILEVGDNEYKCHKEILAANNGFFNTIFEIGMQEEEAGRVKIGLNTQRDNFIDILYFLYTGKVNNFPKSRVFEMMKCAKYFQIPEIEEEAEKYLVEIDSPESLIKFIDETDFRDYKLPQNCLDVFSTYFEYVMEMPKMLDICYKSIVSILSGDICVPSEIDVLNFVLAYDRKNKLPKEKIRELGKLIKWENIDTSEIDAADLNRLVKASVLNAANIKYNEIVQAFPENPLFAIAVSQPTKKDFEELVCRYSKMKQFFFNVSGIDNNTCKMIHTQLHDFNDDGVYSKGGKIKFSIVFERGYAGTFYEFEIKGENMVNVSSLQVEIKYAKNKRSLFSIMDKGKKKTYPLNPQQSNQTISDEFENHGLMKSVTFTFVGAGKQSGKLHLSFEGCITNVV